MLRAGGYPESVHYQDNFPQPSLILTACCSERASERPLILSPPLVLSRRRRPAEAISLPPARSPVGRSACPSRLPPRCPPSRFLIPWSRRQRRSVKLMRRDTPSPGGRADGPARGGKDDIDRGRTGEAERTDPQARFAPASNDIYGSALGRSAA